MATEMIKLDADRPDLDAIRRAAELVDQGKLVVFPTETVYGIACRAKTDSINHLSALKGRTADKYYTLHIGHKSDLKKYVPYLSPIGEKLIRKGWPGPLTIVFELGSEELAQQQVSLEPDVFVNLYRDNTIGIRCPDNAISSLLLGYATNPVVAPSANLTGQPPATNAHDAADYLDSKVDLILDGGRCKYNKSSTVVKLGQGGVKILRQGVYDQRDISEMAVVNMLFVCTGNTCRSPMAEGLCRKYLAQKIGCSIDRLDEMGYKISSAGIMAAPGWQASPEAIEVCSAKGVDISGHRTTPISARLIEQSDYIFVMCEHHRKAVLENSPDAARKMSLLDTRDIPDPIGGSAKDYFYCAEIIEKALIRRLSELLK
jgi:L-threonylcarbamoyladenylate synthase